MSRRRTDDTAVTRFGQATAPGEGSGVPEIVDKRPVFALTIVWHPHAHRAGERVLLYSLATGGDVAVSRMEPKLTVPGTTGGEALDDIYISRKPITFSPLPGGGIRIHAPPTGTPVVCWEAPVEEHIDLTREDIERGVPITLANRVVLLLHLVEPGPQSNTDPMGMIGDSTGMREVRMHIERIARLKVDVLIRGETGTGKELVARAIHEKSQRQVGPYVTLSLPALPAGVVEAELFGAKRGSFTGATQDREGYFQKAHGGTLFFDEVGEAPVEVQTALLRAIEMREVTPVGAKAPVPVDVRIIAATDADLEAGIEQDRVRAAFLYRLDQYRISIPPLRNRREDIGSLAYHFIREKLTEINEGHKLRNTDPHADPWLPAPFAVRLVMYDWPGNIRQLKNVVQRIVAASQGQPKAVIDPAIDVQLSQRSSGKPRTSQQEQPSSLNGHRPTSLNGARPSGSNGEHKPGPESIQPFLDDNVEQFLQHNDESPVSHVPVDNGRARKPVTRKRKPANVSEKLLSETLRKHNWNLTAAAAELGIPRPTLYDLIDRSSTLRKVGDVSAAEIEQCYRDVGGDLNRMIEILQVSSSGLNRRLNELGLSKKRATTKAKKPKKNGKSDPPKA